MGTDKYDEAIDVLNDLNSDHQWVIDQLAYSYYYKGNYSEAVRQWSRYKEIEARFEDSTQTVPFRHRLGMAYAKMGQRNKADSLILAQLKISSEMISGLRSFGTWSARGSLYYDVAICHALLNNYDKAIQYLDSAKTRGFFPYSLIHRDPALQPLMNREDFNAIYKSLLEDEAFKKQAYTNALNRAKASKELKIILNK